MWNPLMSTFEEEEGGEEEGEEEKGEEEGGEEEVKILHWRRKWCGEAPSCT